MTRLSLIQHSAPLISGKPLAAPVSRIAYATNFSETSDHALHWAVQIAEANAADLLLFHVLPPPVPLFEAEPFEKPEAEMSLSVLLTKLHAAGIKAHGFLLTGTNSIDGQIVRAARLERVDLIIMGSHGRTGISRLFSGSLASRVITRAHCPVLIVPGQ
jgi:nucleotide-binding universal stress UspA family protein